MNPAPLIETWDTVMLVAPVLVTVPERDWVLPTVTFPKSKLAGAELSTPDEGGVILPPALTPWQPTKKAIPAVSRMIPAAFLRCLEQFFLASFIRGTEQPSPWFRSKPGPRMAHSGPLFPLPPMLDS